MKKWKWVHVIPEDDVIDHDESESCICGPLREKLNGEDSDSIAFVHQALQRDGDA